MEVHDLRIVAQRGRCTHVNFKNGFTSDFTIDSTYHAHWLYVGINDRKSQLHEKTRYNIKGGMLVCLQINLSLDGHLTYIPTL